jgi:hypothetical protein
MSRLNLGKLPGDDLLPILQSLPSPEDCNRLYQAFKFRVHPVVPICHLPSLEQTMTEFWGDTAMTTSADTLTLILSVAYCGLVSINDERYVNLTRSIFISYERLLDVLSFPNDISKATVPLLQSYLIVNTCRASQIEPLSSFSFLSSAVRIAQALKLNLERKSLSTVVKEVQRRIWWHLVYMDVEAALVSGLPNLIHDDDYTTYMPCQLDDYSITDTQDPVAGSLSVTSPMMLAMHGRWHWALQMRTWRKRKPTLVEFQEFEKTVNDLLSKQAPVDNDGWSHTYLRLHLSRAVCSAARGFLGGQPVNRINCEHKVLRLGL